MSNDIMEQMRSAFQAEALDLLMELDTSLLALEDDPTDQTLVHRVFRAVHTLKGSGSMAGYAHLARFVHKVEETFDLAREGSLRISPELIDCGLKACDVIRRILEAPEDIETVPGEEELVVAFLQFVPDGNIAQAAGRSAEESSDPVGDGRKAYEVIFRPKREFFFSGADPVTLLDDLRNLGHAHITAHIEDVPPFASLEPQQCYLWWEILLITDRDENGIRDEFLFVEDDCDLTIRAKEDQSGTMELLGSVPADAFEIFIAECEDHLEQLEADTLALGCDLANRERLDCVFRGFHNIKGNAGLLLGHFQGGNLRGSHPLQLMRRVAHAVETLLEPFRSPESVAVDQIAAETALESCDAIQTLLESLGHRGPGSSVSAQLLERLGIAMEERKSVSSHEADSRLAFANTSAQCLELMSNCLEKLEGCDSFNSASLHSYSRGLRTLSAAAAYRGMMPLEEPLAIQLRILEGAMKAGENPGTTEVAELRALLAETRRLLSDEDSNSKKMGSKNPVVTKQGDLISADASTERTNSETATSASQATIRIEQSKLDRLMRIVGELLVARGAFPPLVHQLNDACVGSALVKDVKDTGSTISRIADELQSSVMSIRMLPIKTVFQRFPRLVRDLARTLSKEVRLVIEGESIELDKTILEQIGDPLVHILRNALDHGLEPPEERLAKGKPSTGLLTLRATQESNGVTIEVRDDGRGLDAEALKRKAVSKGLISVEEAEVLSEEAAYQLLFLPGLSTAAKVTDVSGRGVGMDVVRSNVRSLQGSIEIRSQLGHGATFLIQLPSSLLVSKGILLEAGGQQYVLPMSTIRDMVKLPRERAHGYGEMLLAQIRGSVYPLVSLADSLGMESHEHEELSIAIIETGNTRYGMIVDRFLTEVEVLVKPLPPGLEEAREFQGAAILGNGSVVLVLNPVECQRRAA